MTTQANNDDVQADDPMWVRFKQIAGSYYGYVNHEGDNRSMWDAMLKQLLAEHRKATAAARADERRAIETALPAQLDDNDSEYEHGYNWAVGQVRTIIQERDKGNNNA